MKIKLNDLLTKLNNEYYFELDTISIRHNMDYNKGVYTNYTLCYNDDADLFEDFETQKDLIIYMNNKNMITLH